MYYFDGVVDQWCHIWYKYWGTRKWRS